MASPSETPSENVLVTATVPMNILRKEDDASLHEACRRELNEEMTPERAMAFIEDAEIEVEAAPEPDQ